MRATFLILILALFVNVNTASTFAQSSKDSALGKGFKSSSLDLESTVYSFKLGTAFDKILNSSVDTDIYDPITISALKRLQDDAMPKWEPDDIDPVRTRRVVEKALAIQSGKSLTQVFNNSELRSTYRAFLRSVSKIQDSLRYSVQENGNGLIVGKSKKGRKLLELNLALNIKQGLDPQIKLGECLRFRYDYTDKATLLEYGFGF